MSNSISTPAIKRLLISHGFFVGGRQFLKIFASLYIWNLTESISDVAIFNIAFYLSHSTFFHLFGSYVKKGHANGVKKTGIAGLTAFYLLLFILGDTTAEYLLPLGIVWGFFNSMYWVSYHVQNFDATHQKNRGNFSGVERAMRIAIGIVVPVLGGYLISQDILNLGYGTIFLIGGALQIVAFLVADIDLPQENYGKLHVRDSLTEIKQNKDLIKALGSGLLTNFGYIRSLKELLILFLFIVLGSELEVGGWVSFFTIISIFSTYVVGKHVPYKRYKAVCLGASTALSGAIISLLFSPILVTYIIFGAIKEFFGPLIGVTRRIYVLNLVHELKDYKRHRVEYMIIREWINVGIGGVLGFLPLLFIDTPTVANLTPVLTAMAVATFAAGVIITRIKTNIEKH